MALPIYYRNSLYTDEQKEKLWLSKLDKGIRWIGGLEIDANNTQEIINALNHYREVSKNLGYGTGEKNWDEEKYQNELRELRYAEREQRRNATNNSNSNNDGSANNAH